MKILNSNIRAEERNSFKVPIYLVRTHSPDIIILMETKINK